ncbi:MAG: hypothetical protein E6Q67_13005 [Roseateles sp.]|nr:MAG: hypothetical protein E6Q67_13005 [Roseateles sp.]
MATRKPDTPRTAGQAAKAALLQVMRERVALWADVDAELGRMIEQALLTVLGQLARAPSDYQQWVLPRLVEGLRRVGDELAVQLGTAAAGGLRQAWQLGERAVSLPLMAAAPFELQGSASAALGQVDLRQLRALQAVNTDRISGATAEMVQQINRQLGQVVLGVQSPFDAMQAVQTLMPEKTKAQVRGIVTSNLGTAFNTASWQALAAQAARDPEIRKQWRRSGKLHSRWNHDLADGQVQPVDQPFVLVSADGRSQVELMYPADPAAPVGEVIHCGCVALPWKAGWKMKRATIQAYSPAEIAARREKAAQAEGKRLPKTGVGKR